MTPADSPENKCPRCGSEDPLVIGEACGYHPLHTPHRWHVEAPRVDGSGRINTSGGATADCDQSSSERNGEVPPSAESQGQAPPVESSAGEADDREASEGRSHAELTFASSPAVDPQCPDCGGMGSDEGGFRGGKKWKAICPSCGGSGRSPVDSGTGTDEKDARPPIDVYAELEGGNWEKWYSAYSDLWELFVNRDAEAVQAESEVELLRAFVPSSPHETGGQHYMSVEPTPEGWCVLCSSDDCEHSVEGRLSPSAAPTNSVPSRSDSEGEKAVRLAASRVAENAKRLDPEGYRVEDVLIISLIAALEGKPESEFGRVFYPREEAGHSPDLSVGEGEGLRARIESALREVLDEQNVDLPVSLAVLLTDAVLEVRAALLVPKEEA